MSVEFLEAAADAVHVSEDKIIYFSWRDGRKIAMPLAACVVTVRRTNVAIDTWHEAERKKVVPLRRKKSG